MLVNSLLLKNLPHIIDKVCKNTAITIAFAYKYMFFTNNATITIKPTTIISEVIFLNKIFSLFDKGFCGVSTGDKIISIIEQQP